MRKRNKNKTKVKNEKKTNERGRKRGDEEGNKRSRRGGSLSPAFQYAVLINLCPEATAQR